MEKVVEVNRQEGDEFTSIATFLPVKRWRDVIAFLRMSGRVEEQLRKTDGVLRYGLKTDLPHRRFWTYSVWNNRQAVGPFVTGEPHATAVRKFAEWAGDGAAFVEWKSSDGKIDWEEANQRLKKPAFYFRRQTG